MSRKTIVLIVILFAVIALGMIWYAGLRNKELSAPQVTFMPAVKYVTHSYEA